ncbi:hypothetical protein Fmac_021214 [Flemingia macrophylla]|uniref:Ubiquitin-like protease family profile domain-containing protein n=1 Tax=Flemingia macrophylla TaxID=520843 RepID=A0ABD1LW93_9FABA
MPAPCFMFIRNALHIVRCFHCYTSASYVDSVQGPSVNIKGDMFTTPVEHVHEEPVRETVKRLESNMQIMMQSLANLAIIVATESPMGRSQSHADSRVTQENIGVKTNRICSSPFQVTKKKNNQKRDKKTQKDSDNKKMKRKLFTVTVGGKDCPLRAVLEPLHGTKYDGLNESVTIPQIFIPLNDNNMHWFLLVVDINKQQLILLDSYKNSDSESLRRRLVRQMRSRFVTQMSKS